MKVMMGIISKRKPLVSASVSHDDICIMVHNDEGDDGNDDRDHV